MIVIKSKEEIKKMKESGKILRSVLDMVKESIKPDVKTIELNKMAEDMIYKIELCLLLKVMVVSLMPSVYRLMMK